MSKEQIYCYYHRHQKDGHLFWGVLCAALPDSRVVKAFFSRCCLLDKKNAEEIRQIRNAIEKFDGQRIKDKRLLYDVIFSCFTYGASPDEYFLFDFERRNSSGRAAFVCDKERFDLERFLYDFSRYEEIRNKYQAYCSYKEFYKRDCLLINKDTASADFEAFVSKHRVFVYKPTRAYCGIGVKKIDISDYPSVDALYKELTALGEGLADEMIHQVEETKRFNPSSVNSVRIVTFLDSKRDVSFIAPFFRSGRSSSFVDNCGSGGFFAEIDIDTGIICTQAADESGHHSVVHPDSGVPFVGWQVPNWDELLSLSRRIAQKTEFARCLGLDFALTDKGWVVIEINAFPQFVSQIPSQKGLKAKLLGILAKCK